MLAPFIHEKEGNSVKRCKADSGIDDSGDKGKVWSENCGYQVKVEYADQSPVQSANNHQDEYQFFQSYHSFRMYFTPKPKKYDIIYLRMCKSVCKIEFCREVTE